MTDTWPLPSRIWPSIGRFGQAREIARAALFLPSDESSYLVSVNAVIPGIMAGNVVILKVSHQTPLVAGRYAEAFNGAGLPDDVFQYLHAGHDDVARMIEDCRINFVSCTGSIEGGCAVQAAAARRFMATNLELGGKDPAYVRPDAPLEATIENARGRGVLQRRPVMPRGRADLHASGRVWPVRRTIRRADAPVSAWQSFAPRYMTLGPMVRASAAEFVRTHVAEAVEQGARPLIDPREFPADREGTPYMAPQVLIDVDHRMRVMTEETFGPVVGVMAVKDDNEAVELMNDSRYGLTASIWTTDIDAAVRIGDRVETGTWFLNRCDYLDPALAWTGVRDSGRGCSLSRLGYDAPTRPKSFHLRVNL